MEIALHTRQHCYVVMQIAGQIDTTTAEQLQAAFRAELRPEKTYLIADLSQTSYINSAGLRVLLATLQSIRQTHGDLLLAAVSRQVYRVLEISGFTELLQVYPNVEAACAVAVEACS